MKTEAGRVVERKGTARATTLITAFMRLRVASGCPSMPSAAPSSMVARKERPARAGNA